MPREDVPYPMNSQICSIRERIAELQDEINGLLATINSVGGDGQKDIKLLSDNAALTITSDQVQHEIHLDLDTSQLPAADVNSVNGQTGTVVLDGDDLDGVTPGNSVNDDISALQTADGTLQSNINAEALARQNADSTLQGNINAALATIPGEVSSQIANNAAIIQLQNDVLAIPNKVDKRTGTGKFAYTHNGATQGDIALIDGTTGATIPIRDANGRMQAADPASGDTSQKVATTNWVSQTGDSSPNNLVHRTGNERIYNIKTFSSIYIDSNNGPTNLTNIVQDEKPTSQKQIQMLKARDSSNAKDIMFLQLIDDPSGTRSIRLNVYSSNGTRVILPLMIVAEDGTTTYPWS